MLGRRETAWAEAIFAAILPGEAAGLPAFASIDRTVFWRCLAESTGPAFRIGFRAMVVVLTQLPRFHPRWRRPFHALAPADQAAFLAALAGSRRAAARQLVETMKILACFAYLDAAAVRARLDADA